MIGFAARLRGPGKSRLMICSHYAAEEPEGPCHMNDFFLFWVLVAADFLNPVAAVGGIATGLVGGTGRVKAGFAVVGVAVTVMAVLVQLHNPSGYFSDAAYLVGAQFLAMMVWTAFVVALVYTCREFLPTKADPAIINRLSN